MPRVDLPKYDFGDLARPLNDPSVELKGAASSEAKPPKSAEAPAWVPVTDVAKDIDGNYLALTKGHWVSTERVAKNGAGSYVAIIKLHADDVANARFEQLRLYDVPKYGMRFGLANDRIEMMLIASPIDLSTEKETGNWRKCD